MEFSWKLFGNVESQISEATMSKKQKLQSRPIKVRDFHQNESWQI